MFAFDTAFPINILFVLFLLLCLYACAVSMSEAPEGDDAEDDLPAAFRDLAKMTDIPPVQWAYCGGCAARAGAARVPWQNIGP